MYYYLVGVANHKYHGNKPLTYASDHQLEPGSIVSIPLQKQTAFGFIVEKTTKPSFQTKQIATSYSDLGLLPKTSLELFAWIQQYYPGPIGATAQLFMPGSLPRSLPRLDAQEAASGQPSSTLPVLTASQKSALSEITPAGSYVVHGETGSGKTRLYIERARKAIQKNKSAIILTPEISLTSQLAQEFAKVFPSDQLVIMHSQLTPATRRNIWLRLLNSVQPIVIIGPRSALFSPVRDIDFIAIDESHEFAYKQESVPYYHATRVASKLAELHKATLILGSATPSVDDYYIAQAKQRPIIQLPTLASEHSKSIMQIIDMRDSANLGKNKYLSRPLIEGAKQALDAEQQVMLFINRRGTARIILCEHCGWQAACPHCDLPFTYHHDEHILRCHTCGITEKAVLSCPVCHGTDIILKSIGTKSIASEIQKLFPSSRVERFDTDNRTGERLHEVYDAVRDGSINILVGTQILAKGLDLPKLGFVGVINADASLYLPDFTAQERTYQLLYQVIGRVGRSSQSAQSRVVIQTYSPENTTLQAAAAKDWDTFYSNEIEERQNFLFPPFCHLLKVSCKRARSTSAQSNAEKLAQTIAKSQLAVHVDGPAPAFHEKIQNKYVWQLIIKSRKRSELLKVIDLLPTDWSYDIDPANLL